MLRLKDVIGNKLLYEYYIHEETDTFTSSNMLKKLGLHPKNREIMLEALTQDVSDDLYDFIPYDDYCEQSDIEFLYDKIDRITLMRVLYCSQNLSIKFIEKMGLDVYHISNVYVRNRTYEDLYNIIFKYSYRIFNIVNTKPKNPREKYYKKMMQEQPNTCTYRPNIRRMLMPVGTIFVYSHLRKKLIK